MGWYTCNVNRAGPADDGNMYIMLTDQAGAFGGRWFVALTAQQKPMLATALTALTLNLPVTAALADPPNEYTQISRLYVMKS
jgi:hypothetical protein